MFPLSSGRVGEEEPGFMPNRWGWWMFLGGCRLIKIVRGLAAGDAHAILALLGRGSGRLLPLGVLVTASKKLGEAGGTALLVRREADEDGGELSGVVRWATKDGKVERGLVVVDDGVNALRSDEGCIVLHKGRMRKVDGTLVLPVCIPPGSPPDSYLHLL